MRAILRIFLPHRQPHVRDIKYIRRRPGKKQNVRRKCEWQPSCSPHVCDDNRYVKACYSNCYNTSSAMSTKSVECVTYYTCVESKMISCNLK